MKNFFITILFTLVLIVILTPSLVSAIVLKDPLTGGGTTVPTVDASFVTTKIGAVASIIIGTAGSFALLMFVYGGFMILSSAGNPERLGSGKQILIWAVIGLLAIMSSFLVLRLVIEAVTGGSIT